MIVSPAPLRGLSGLTSRRECPERSSLFLHVFKRFLAPLFAKALCQWQSLCGVCSVCVRAGLVLALGNVAIRW